MHLGLGLAVVTGVLVLADGRQMPPGIQAGNLAALADRTFRDGAGRKHVYLYPADGSGGSWLVHALAQDPIATIDFHHRSASDDDWGRAEDVERARHARHQGWMQAETGPAVTGAADGGWRRSLPWGAVELALSWHDGSGSEVTLKWDPLP